MTIKFKKVKLPKLLIKADKKKTEESSYFSSACKVYIIATSHAFCVGGPKGLFGLRKKYLLEIFQA